MQLPGGKKTLHNTAVPRSGRSLELWSNRVCLCVHDAVLSDHSVHRFPDSKHTLVAPCRTLLAVGGEALLSTTRTQTLSALLTACNRLLHPDLDESSALLVGSLLLKLLQLFPTEVS